MPFSEEYYSKNRDTILKQQHEYRQKHIMKIRKKERFRSKKNRKKHRILEKAWRKRNPEKQYEYNRVLTTRYRNSIYLSKQRNKLFLLSVKQYVSLIQQGCRYCGESLLLERGIGLDRLNNKKNYTLNNVVPCCGRCNDVRGNKYTFEQMLVIGKAVRKALDNMEREK